MSKPMPDHDAWKPKARPPDRHVDAPAPASAAQYLDHFDRTGAFPPGADAPWNATSRAAAEAVLASRPRTGYPSEPELGPTPSRARQVWTLLLAAVGVFWIGAMIVGMIAGGLNGTGNSIPPADSDYMDCSHSTPQNC